ncbi:DUF2188 domain-containing protein [Kocuria nitroreducens]|uniref:DUF2188 domain-containing protein n=1 Tax=Kocuria nitroreducens TaxID=3058914 RepID=UPI0036DE6F05
MGTSRALGREPRTDVHRPVDRLVAPGDGGTWEVRSPDASATVLCADTRRTAIEWAWNITRSTGGKVVVHPVAGTCREC